MAVLTRTRLALALGLVTALHANAADPPVRLNVKPLLCVLDKNATACAVTFDVRWKSVRAAEYCLHDEAQPAPLKCWPSAVSGESRHDRHSKQCRPSVPRETKCAKRNDGQRHNAVGQRRPDRDRGWPS